MMQSSTTVQPVQIDLARALKRHGLEPADRLSHATAVALAELLGIPRPPAGVNLVSRVKAKSELPRLVLARLADLHPDLTSPVEPGYRRGRKLEPLHDRLARLLARMPENERMAGVHLETVRVRLRGNFGPHARAAEVGAALRACGWVRIKSWCVDEAGRHETRWFPPNHPVAQAEVARLHRLAERRQQRERAEHAHQIDRQPAQEHAQ